MKKNSHQGKSPVFVRILTSVKTSELGFYPAELIFAVEPPLGKPMSLSILYLLFIAAGGFCVFINLMLSTFYGNPGFATSESSDNQSVPVIARFHLFSFPGISLILLYTGLTGFWGFPFEGFPVNEGMPVLTGVLLAWITGTGTTWLIGLWWKRHEGIEALIRCEGQVTEAIGMAEPGRVCVAVQEHHTDAPALEKFHRPVTAGTKIRVIGIAGTVLLVEAV